MDAGKLDKLISIEQRTLTQDAAGQEYETWVSIATVYANVKPLIGKDYLAAKQTVDELSHDITIRYRRGIKPKMRVNYLGRIIEIVAVIDPNESREWLYLKCKEVISE